MSHHSGINTLCTGDKIIKDGFCPETRYFVPIPHLLGSHPSLPLSESGSSRAVAERPRAHSPLQEDLPCYTAENENACPSVLGAEQAS